MPAPEEEVELVAYLIEHEAGLSTIRSKNIAAMFADGGVREFLDTAPEELAAMKSPKGRPLLRGEEPEKVVSASRAYDRSLGVRENWALLLAGRFTARQLETIRGLRLESLTINPLLVRSLKLEEPEDVVRFNVYQAATRSIVTSMGNAIEDIVLRSGGERIEQGGSGFGFKKTLGEDVYWIQIKSGTNTMNVSMVNDFWRYASRKEREAGRNIARLGLTYGKKEQVSGQIKGNLPGFDERVIVGRELWEFVSGEDGYHERVLALMERAAEKTLGSDSVIDAIEDSIARITAEFRVKYGNGPDAVERAIKDLI